jgi:hypothetical protein
MRDDETKEHGDAAHQMANTESRLAERKRALRAARIYRRGLIIGAAGLGTVLGLHYAGKITLSLWAVVPIWAVVILVALASFGTETGTISDEIEKLESVQRLYSSILNIKTDEPYFDRLVNINVENLSEYYALVKQHSRKSFNLSFIIVVLGFVLIVVGIAIGFANTEYRNISYLAAAAGIIVNFIGGAVFVLYTRTVLQLKQYHDSLLDVQNILLSFKLIEGTSEVAERSAMTLRMIEFLSSRRVPLSP